jgi:hypothetical protein
LPQDNVRIDKTVAAIIGEIVTALSLQRASMTAGVKAATVNTPRRGKP